jgi:hypothetical protein
MYIVQYFFKSLQFKVTILTTNYKGLQRIKQNLYICKKNH